MGIVALHEGFVADGGSKPPPYDESRTNLKHNQNDIIIQAPIPEAFAWWYRGFIGLLSAHKFSFILQHSEQAAEEIDDSLEKGQCDRDLALCGFAALYGGCGYDCRAFSDCRDFSRLLIDRNRVGI